MFNLPQDLICDRSLAFVGVPLEKEVHKKAILVMLGSIFVLRAPLTQHYEHLAVDGGPELVAPQLIQEVEDVDTISKP